MTFTFKLSRRLAVAHSASALALAALTACGSESLVDSSSQNSSLNAVVVAPGAVTTETKQPIRLAAYGRSESGDSVGLSDLQWTASGGTISADGTFMADAPGSYTLTVLSKNQKRSGHGTVVVVPPSPSLTAVEISPASVGLSPSGKQAFTAVGRLSDGSTSTIGVTWAASGGAIDAAGLYTAGTTVGTFRVIATNASSGLADTAIVQIAQASTPTAQAIVLAPGSVTLAAGATQQLTAMARLSDGTTAPAAVTYSATGGTISAAGLYSAGQTAGTFRVVAVQSGGALADTATVTVTAPVNTGLYPHQPAGLSRVVENSFDGRPGAGAGVEAGTWDASGANLSTSTDASAPQSGGGVAVVKWLKGLDDGNGGGAYFNAAFGRPYKELYVSWRVKIPTPDFENQLSPGVKLLGYLSYGKTDRRNQFFLQMKSTSETQAVQSGPWSFRSDFTSEYALAGTSNPAQDYFDNQGTGNQFHAGNWQQVEMYFKLNDDGKENGVYKLWINGVLVQSYTNVTMINSAVGATQGFYQLHFDPIWGGNAGQIKQRDDAMYIDHVYISGVAQ